MSMPALRFKEFSDAWVETKIGEITTKVGSGSTPRGGVEVYQSTGIPFIRSQNVNNEKLLLNDITYISHEINNQMKGSSVKPNDILLNITGASIGRSCVVPSDFEVGNVNQHVCIIRLKSEYAPRFLQPYLSSSLGQKSISSTQVGSGREGLNFEAIRSFKIFTPTLAEQTKIANFLTAVDEKVQLLTQKSDLLAQYKKGVMQKIFSEELRFKDDDGHEFPEWERMKVSNFLIERNIQTPKSEKYPLMAFIANKGVSDKGERYDREFLVNNEDSKKYKQTEYGDFIYSSNNLETGSIGLNNYGSATISPVYSVFQITELCNRQFIGCLFSRKEFINKMIRWRQGVVYGQWRIHESNFLKIEEKIPCLSEQTKIANFLSAIDDKITQTQAELAAVKQYKQGLLQQMFV